MRERPTFTDVAALRAHYAAVRARLNGGGVVRPVRALPGPCPDRPREGLAPADPGRAAMARARRQAGAVSEAFRTICCSPPREADAHVVAWRMHRASDGGSPFLSADRVKADFRAVCPVPWTDIVSERRTRDVVIWRQALMAALRTLTVMSMPQIGRHLGGRDHTTVLHACRVVEAARQAGTAIAVAGPTGVMFWVRTGGKGDRQKGDSPSGPVAGSEQGRIAPGTASDRGKTHS